MGATTGISWTDHTFNSHMGCQRISPACGGAKGVGGCYAEALVVGRMGYNLNSADPRRRLKVWGSASTSTRVRTSADNWKNPLKWDRAAKAAGVRRRVFCASLADVFEDHPALGDVRADLWPLIERCDGLDWQLLTKRPENIRAMVPPSWLVSWPAHVWVGCTVESQEYAEKRIPHLLSVPAKVRFLSCEPLLEAVELSRWLGGMARHAIEGHAANCDGSCFDLPAVAWVIVGGESGPGARPFDLAWARSIVAQCRASRVPVFMKQLGAFPLCEKKDESRLNVAWRGGWALNLRGRAGADPGEWPADLQVQEFPGVTSG